MDEGGRKWLIKSKGIIKLRPFVVTGMASSANESDVRDPEKFAV